MTSSKTVLIIDDSPLIISRLREMLEGLPGIELVLHADRFSRGFPFLAHYSPQIVFLDIHLPEINGLEALRQIKRDYPSIVVIMMTNQAEQLYRERCLELGADFFIDKSVEFPLIPPIITSL